jgi:hypothetical protein
MQLGKHGITMIGPRIGHQALTATLAAMMLAGCSGANGSVPASLASGGERSTASLATRSLSATVNGKIVAAPGSTVKLACAVTLNLTDTADTHYQVTAWGTGTRTTGAGPFPIENYPTTSDLAWSLDRSATYTAMANSGSPGQSVFAGTVAGTQSHCLNYAVTVPASIAPGNYQASVDFHLYGSTGTLLSLKAITTVAVDVLVTNGNAPD